MKQYFKGDSLQKVKFNRQICVYWRQIPELLQVNANNALV